jgi:hypothetical protein
MLFSYLESCAISQRGLHPSEDAGTTDTTIAESIGAEDALSFTKETIQETPTALAMST